MVQVAGWGRRTSVASSFVTYVTDTSFDRSLKLVTYVIK